MNILERAKQIYNLCGYSDMCQDLSAYMANGCVYLTPDSLLVLKPVCRDSEEHPANQWNVINPDAWYVQVIIGEVRKLIKVIPYDLPYIGWERGINKTCLKWFKMENLKRRNKICQHCSD